MKNLGNSVISKNAKDKKEIEEFIKLYESYGLNSGEETDMKDIP